MHVQKADNLYLVYRPTPTTVEAPITSANAPRTPDVRFSFPGTGSSLLDESPQHSRSKVRAPIGKGDLITPNKIQSDGGHLFYANERSIQPTSDYFPLFNTSRPKQQPYKKQDYRNKMSQHEYRLRGQTIPHTSKLDDHLYDYMDCITNTCKSVQNREQDRGNNQNGMENSRYLAGYYVDCVGTNPITYRRPGPTSNVNTATSMQTSWVEQQPSDNVRMSMNLESRGSLQCDTEAKDTRKEESNSMQRNASHLSNVCQSKLPVSIEMNNNLKSDSTFSIECQVMGERMVSALYTTPVKDTEERLDFQNEKDLHVKNWLNSISFDGMSPNTDASYMMDVKEDDCVSDSSTVCVPVLIKNRDLTKRYMIPNSFSSRSDWSCETASPMFKNNSAVQSTKLTYCNSKRGERLSRTSGIQSNETVLDFENNNYVYYAEKLRSYLNESVPKLYPQVDINYIQTLCEEFSKKGSTFHSSNNSRFGSIDGSQAQICEDLYFSSLMMIQCWTKLRCTFKSQNVDCQFQLFTPEIKHSFDLLQANIFQMLQHICSYVEMLNEKEIKLRNFKVSDNYSKINNNLKNDTQSSSTVCMNSANNLTDKHFLQPRGHSIPPTSLNEMITADLRVLVTPIETTSIGCKVSREKKENSTNKQGEETLVWTPGEKRGLCGARKRRFRDRAAERMMAEIDEEDGSRAAVIVKGYAREKERWGIWCSSRRRRGLSKMARDKLEAILNMIWNMEEAEFIKYAVVSTSIPDYYRIVKHPMDLSDIARKLRNIIYETIEQFVHDFRLIFYNIRLYNEKGSVYYKKGATLSQRFDELLEDNFPGWEFKSITGSPRELNTNPTLRYRAFDDHRKSTAKHLSQHNSQNWVASLVSILFVREQSIECDH